MNKSKGKLNESNIGWCNVVLSTGKFKLVKAELIDKDNMIFKLWSNHSQMNLFDDWTECEQKDFKGWYYKECFEEDINEFFDNPFK
jgi:hypothetical protein